MDENGALVGAGDLAAQTTQAMHNIAGAVAAARASFADVVKITTYVVNYKSEHRVIVGKARSPFFATCRHPQAPSSARLPRRAGMAGRDRGCRRHRLTTAIKTPQSSELDQKCSLLVMAGLVPAIHAFPLLEHR